MCTLKDMIKGLLTLLAVLAYQLMCFMAFVSFSIGFSVVVTRIYEYLMNPAILPSSCESFVSMFLICLFAEFHIFCQHECIGHAILHYYRKYIFLPVVTSLIYTVIYIIAFSQLYQQFHDAHYTVREIDPYNRERAGDRFPIAEEMPQHGPLTVMGVSGAAQVPTAYFLFSLSYIVYCTMKLIDYDAIEQIKRITNQASCIHCVVTLGFLGVHMLMNVLYSIPLIIVAFSLRLYKVHGATAYVELSAVGLLSGMIFAVIETRRPWPTSRALLPFYLYENNTRSKAVLGQIQIILILIVFYRPISSGKIHEKNFNAGNDFVLSFCFIVAFTMLHYVKILTFITIQKNNVPPPPQELQGDDEDAEAMMGELAIVDSQQQLDNNANVILVLPTDQKCDNCRNQQECMKQFVEAAAKETKNEVKETSFTHEERFVMNLLKHQPGLKILELLPPPQKSTKENVSDSKIVEECLNQVIQQIVEDEGKSGQKIEKSSEEENKKNVLNNNNIEEASY